MPLSSPDGDLVAVLFALDDTLVPFQTVAAWQWAWRPQGPLLGERHARAAIRRSQHTWDRRRWRGLVGLEPPADLSAFREHIKETLWAVAGHPLPEAETQAVVQRFLRPAGEVEAFPDVPPTLARLASAGVTVGAVTTLPIESARWLLRRNRLPEGLLMLAGDDPTVAPLPAPATFSSVLERIGAKARQTAFVGDLFWSGVRAAGRAGLTPVLLDRSGTWPKVGGRRIGRLDELESALARPPETSQEPAEEPATPAP